MKSRPWQAAFALAVQPLVCVVPAIAQDEQPAVAPATVTAAATATEDADEAPDPAKLTMPKLDFVALPADVDDYDKYFYFHRDDTSFAEAYADIKECDALASGISFYVRQDPGALGAATAQYGALAGGIGSALGTALADAIFGSAERRKLRRVNLRNCMAFKEYHRYGLNHALWDAFNFEEGMGRKREGVRLQALELQALVASGPKPQTKELGL